MSKALINQLSEIEIIFGHLISGNLQLVMSVTWASLSIMVNTKPPFS